MGTLSLWHWLAVGIAVILLFGRGRFSAMMSDVADGLRSFRRGLSEDELRDASRDPLEDKN